MTSWVFQSNPRRFDLLAGVGRGPDATWAVNQHRGLVAAGDRVFFYHSNPDAGIYVVGRVVGPVAAAEESYEYGRWRVPIKYEALVRPPLLRAALIGSDEPLLASQAVFTRAQGTNFRLPEATAARLEALLEGRLQPITVAPTTTTSATAHGQSLVLASNPTTASGHQYADIEGVQYEYPTRYQSQIQTGRRFVYYRSGEGTDDPFYFGVGIIGEVNASPQTGRLICDILDYQPFEHALPFKDDLGGYREPEGSRKGYYQPGVRTVSDEVFDQIVAAAALVVPPPVVTPTTRTRRPRPTRQYASAEHARRVEELFVRLVASALVGRYPGADIRQMPHSNPGYDFEVGPPKTVERYVEVKGTIAGYVDFFVSEGERAFSGDQADRYSLAVVHSIDLDAQTGTIVWFDGEIDDRFELKPTQWRAREQSE
jgi:hypothetical protein